MTQSKQVGADDRVTFCEDEPDAIDEIVCERADLHIERMDDQSYWMRVGERTFWISTKKRGRCIITEQR